MAKFLKNNGKPRLITIDKQKCIDWYESDGKRKVLEIAWAGRESLDGKETKEKELVKQLGIGAAQKALTYYDKDAQIIPGKPMEVSNGRPLGRPKIMYADESFSVVDFPHIVDYYVGGYGEGETYSIPVAGSDLCKRLGADFVKIESDAHAEQLMKVYHFVDEVNEKGEIIRENPFRLKEDNKPVQGNIPNNMIEFDIKNAPRKSSINKRATLTRNDQMD